MGSWHYAIEIDFSNSNLTKRPSSEHLFTHGWIEERERDLRNHREGSITLVTLPDHAGYSECLIVREYRSALLREIEPTTHLCWL